MENKNIKFKSNIGCMHCDCVILKGNIARVFYDNAWVCPECRGRNSIIKNMVDKMGENLKSSKVLLLAYHSNSDDKGKLISNTELELSELNDLINEAISYGYYIQITPSKALVDERKENGDLLFMYSSNRLVQR